MARLIPARIIEPGDAAGAILAAAEPLSFWGGYDQRTGEIIDRRHPLSGRNAAGRVLVLPGSRGSSTTSAVLLESVSLGTAPAAIVTTGVDRFVALAAVVARELYGHTFAVLAVDPSSLSQFGDGRIARIEAAGILIED
ncbi:MAG: DUF126 domain-containing protein [Gemmatimonadales bacterium]